MRNYKKKMYLNKLRRQYFREGNPQVLLEKK